MAASTILFMVSSDVWKGPTFRIRPRCVTVLHPDTRMASVTRSEDARDCWLFERGEAPPDRRPT